MNYMTFSMCFIWIHIFLHVSRFVKKKNSTFIFQLCNGNSIFRDPFTIHMNNGTVVVISRKIHHFASSNTMHSVLNAYRILYLKLNRSKRINCRNGIKSILCVFRFLYSVKRLMRVRIFLYFE